MDFRKSLQNFKAYGSKAKAYGSKAFVKGKNIMWNKKNEGEKYEYIRNEIQPDIDAINNNIKPDIENDNQSFAINMDDFPIINELLSKIYSFNDVENFIKFFHSLSDISKITKNIYDETQKLYKTDREKYCSRKSILKNIISHKPNKQTLSWPTTLRPKIHPGNCLSKLQMFMLAIECIGFFEENNIKRNNSYINFFFNFYLNKINEYINSTFEKEYLISYIHQIFENYGYDFELMNKIFEKRINIYERFQNNLQRKIDDAIQIRERDNGEKAEMAEEIEIINKINNFKEKNNIETEETEEIGEWDGDDSLVTSRNNITLYEWLVNGEIDAPIIKGGYKNKKSRKAKKAKRSRKGKKSKRAKRTRKGKKGKKAKRTRKRK